MIVEELFAKLGLEVDASGFKAGEAAVGALKGGLLAVGAALGAAAAGLTAMVKGTVDAASKINDTSKATGISTDALQELGHAAKLSGIGFDELAGGLKKLSKAAYEAATKGGQAGAAFQTLGVSATGADGKVRPAEELIGDLAAKFASMPDGVEKTALAMELFGRSGATMIPLLDEGGEGLAKMRAEARKLGIVLSAETVAAGDALGDSLDSLQASFVGLRNAIAVKLIPAFQRSTEAKIAWVVANRQWIATKVHEAINFATRAVEGLWGVLKPLVALVREHTALFVGLGLVFLALTSPILAVVAALGLLAEDFAVFQKGEGKSVIGALVNAFRRFGDEAGKAWEKFKDNPFGTLKVWAEEFFAWFFAKIDEIPGRMLAALTPSKQASVAGGVPIYDTPLDWLASFMPGDWSRANGVQAMAPQISTPGRSAFPPSGTVVTIGELKLNATPGGDPEAFARSFGDALGPLLEERWNAVLREAEPVVGR